MSDGETLTDDMSGLWNEATDSCQKTGSNFQLGSGRRVHNILFYGIALYFATQLAYATPARSRAGESASALPYTCSRQFRVWSWTR
jgi:hypothetical protein